jgi:hypothetical protein
MSVTARLGQSASVTTETEKPQIATYTLECFAKRCGAMLEVRMRWRDGHEAGGAWTALRAKAIEAGWQLGRWLPGSPVYCPRHRPDYEGGVGMPEDDQPTTSEELEGVLIGVDPRQTVHELVYASEFVKSVGTMRSNKEAALAALGVANEAAENYVPFQQS